MRRSDHSPSSTDPDRYFFWFLDALVDAPSSFAASLVFVRTAWHDASTPVGISDHFASARRAVASGFARCRISDPEGTLRDVGDGDWSVLEREYSIWLADVSAISSADVSFDPVGLWLEITELGRAQWDVLRKQLAPAEQQGDTWGADYDAEQQIISAKASSPHNALAAVKRLAEALDLRLDEGSCQTSEIGRSHSHTEQSDAFVEVRCRVRPRSELDQGDLG